MVFGVPQLQSNVAHLTETLLIVVSMLLAAIYIPGVHPPPPHQHRTIFSHATGRADFKEDILEEGDILIPLADQPATDTEEF